MVNKHWYDYSLERKTTESETTDRKGERERWNQSDWCWREELKR